MMAVLERPKPGKANLERLVADAFRRKSWRVRRAPADGDAGPGLVVEGGGKKYVIELKSSSEGRRDRLVPLLSQAILQVQAYARSFPAKTVPVAVVAAERIPVSVAEHLRQFASHVAPGVAIGVVDAQGLRVFAGHGLEALNADPFRVSRNHVAGRRRMPHLFSDLNQWMLKILLAQPIAADLLSAPRERFRNASRLAQAANVSVMSAIRFVRQLENEGFLEQGKGYLEAVRIPELLRRWSAAIQQSERDMPARWIIKGAPGQLSANLKAYASGRNAVGSPAPKARSGRKGSPPLRACLGLFAAADALGVGFVHGAPPYVYLEAEDPDVLRRLGLSVENAEHSPDVYIRIPANGEAVFRAAVIHGGVPVSDILQIWLDVSTHPSRGRAQADEIRKRVLGPLFRKR